VEMEQFEDFPQHLNLKFDYKNHISRDNDK
jgi:hypothetical protein